MNNVAFKELAKDILFVDKVFTSDELLLIQKFFGEKKPLFQEKPSQARVKVLDDYFEGNRKPLYYWINKETDLQIDSFLFANVQSIIQKLYTFYNGNLNIVKDSGYRLNLYPKGHGYAFHVDQSNYTYELSIRRISILFSLNSNYEGGSIRFPRQDLELSLEENQVIVFPSGYTHPHEVTPVRSGERHTLVTWLT